MTDERVDYSLQDMKMVIFLERARISIETAQAELEIAWDQVKQVEVALERRKKQRWEQEEVWYDQGTYGILGSYLIKHDDLGVLTANEDPQGMPVAHINSADLCIGCSHMVLHKDYGDTLKVSCPFGFPLACPTDVTVICPEYDGGEWPG